MTLFGDPMQGILAAWTVAIVATISPGPSLLATMRTAMVAGRRASMALALGVSCGSLTWGLLATLGFSTLLVSWTGALDGVRVLGALYLLFLGCKAFRSAASRHGLNAGGVTGPGSRSYFLRGWGIHLANPSAIFTWVAITALGLRPSTPWWAAAAVLAGAITFAGAFYTVAAIAFSMPTVVRLYTRAQRAINAGLGICFLYVAWRLAARWTFYPAAVLTALMLSGAARYS